MTTCSLETRNLWLSAISRPNYLLPDAKSRLKTLFNQRLLMIVTTSLSHLILPTVLPTKGDRILRTTVQSRRHSRVRHHQGVVRVRRRSHGNLRHLQSHSRRMDQDVVGASGNFVTCRTLSTGKNRLPKSKATQMLTGERLLETMSRCRNPLPELPENLRVPNRFPDLVLRHLRLATQQNRHTILKLIWQNYAGKGDYR